jgi:predicted AAA+ superfamily ATPase
MSILWHDGFMDYQSRLADAEVARQLAVAGAVLVRGPKGCGKTATSRIHASSEILIDDSPTVQTAMEADPAYLLQGETPRLIDEWQEQPRLWNTVRHEVDRRRAKGQFILTGSSTPRDEHLRGLHSGVGRFGIVDMETMTWSERHWSSGEVSLVELLEGREPKSAPVEMSLPTIAERLVIGGWPGTLDLDAESARLYNVNYYRVLTETDFRNTAGGRRSPETVRRVMQSLARNVSSECDSSNIAADIGGPDRPAAFDTVAAYLDALDRLMVRSDLPAWNTHIRSRARLRTSPKRHFCDPSLACAALGITPDALLADLEYLGLLFESAAIHDLRIYARSLGGKLAHYRDSNKLEADAIIELPDGSWAAAEIKLGFGAVPNAAASLLAVANNIDQSRIGPPRALLIITGSGFAHKRPDGINVVPLNTLRG